MVLVISTADFDEAADTREINACAQRAFIGIAHTDALLVENHRALLQRRDARRVAVRARGEVGRHHRDARDALVVVREGLARVERVPRAQLHRDGERAAQHPTLLAVDVARRHQRRGGALLDVVDIPRFAPILGDQDVRARVRHIMALRGRDAVLLGGAVDAVHVHAAIVGEDVGPSLPTVGGVTEFGAGLKLGDGIGGAKLNE